MRGRDCMATSQREAAAQLSLQDTQLALVSLRDQLAASNSELHSTTSELTAAKCVAAQLHAELQVGSTQLLDLQASLLLLQTRAVASEQGRGAAAVLNRQQEDSMDLHKQHLVTAKQQLLDEREALRQLQAQYATLDRTCSSEKVHQMQREQQMVMQQQQISGLERQLVDVTVRADQTLEQLTRTTAELAVRKVAACTTETEVWMEQLSSARVAEVELRAQLARRNAENVNLQQNCDELTALCNQLQAQRNSLKGKLPAMFKKVSRLGKDLRKHPEIDSIHGNGL